MTARLTPDQKVGSFNLSAVMFPMFEIHVALSPRSPCIQRVVSCVCFVRSTSQTLESMSGRRVFSGANVNLIKKMRRQMKS